MKRFFCFLLITLLILSACGKRTSNGQGTESSGSMDSGMEESVKPDDTAADAASKSGLGTGDLNEPESVSSESAQPLTYTLVVPEGTTLARIGMMLEEKGVATVDEFITASQDGDFSGYPLVAEQSENPNRCFKLEGYLFPDTYDIYYSDTPDAIIRKMLDHTEKKINADLREKISASGYTVDEILTMASIIEEEALGDEHMPMISSVLHNRLDSGMRLQCDVTIIYVEGAIKPFITGDKDRYNSYYNTYKCPALPAGAISNPGIAAINAALRPAESDYLFFVTDSEKNYYYAATWEEHEKNVAVAMG